MYIQCKHHPQRPTGLVNKGMQFSREGGKEGGIVEEKALKKAMSPGKRVISCFILSRSTLWFCVCPNMNQYTAVSLFTYLNPHIACAQ